MNSVGLLITWNHVSLQVLKFTALSADAHGEEPIDIVCLESYPDSATLWDNYKLVKFVPFNPVDKFTMAIIQDAKTGNVFRVLKGAPQVMVSILPWVL